MLVALVLKTISKLTGYRVKPFATEGSDAMKMFIPGLTRGCEPVKDGWHFEGFFVRNPSALGC